MAEIMTINSDPLEPGIDFQLLRREGINHIARLAGSVWTDYNSHDPGITTLEQLCFLMTDIGYRLSFDIKDLLTPAASDPQTHEDQFFTAKQALTMNPLTLNDYRRIISEIDGVKNVWIEAIRRSLPTMFWDNLNNRQTFIMSDNTEQVALKGLYRVLLEITEGEDPNQVKDAVKELLYQNRNLCEDFVEVIVLPVEEISFKGSFEFKPGFDPEDTLVKVHRALDSFISPLCSFSSLSELLNSGSAVEDIYMGPVLTKGFLPESVLNAVQRKMELRVSDLIHIILDTEGVKDISDIRISNKMNPTKDDWREWALSLSTGRAYKLKGSSQATAGLTPLFPGYYDLSIPIGVYRELNKYQSVQYEFPSTYGIGKWGLSNDATKERIAQAKQLQAYLSFFDQIFANYFAQLARAKDLFAVQNSAAYTCFSQEILDAPGADNFLKGPYQQDLPLMSENTEFAIQLRNRILDHLLARHGESFLNYSKLLLPKLSDIIDYKKRFLSRCAEIGAKKCKAFDYKDQDGIWDTDNISGLKRRLSELLVIKESKRESIANTGQEGFHMMENILLRPKGHKITGYFMDDNMTGCMSPSKIPQLGATVEIFEAEGYTGRYTVKSSEAGFFTINKAFEVEARRVTRRGYGITNIKENTGREGTICECIAHGLETDDIIEVYNAEIYDGKFTVYIENTNEFIINTPFNPLGPSTGDWRRIDQIISFQQGTDPSKTWCVSPGHTLLDGDIVKIFDAKVYDGQYTITLIDDDTFEVEKEFNPTGTQNGLWRRVKLVTKFYSENGITTFISPNHGFEIGDKLEIFISGEYQGKWTVSQIQTDNFVVNKMFEARWKRIHKIDEFLESVTIFKVPDHGFSHGDVIELYAGSLSLGKHELIVPVGSVDEFRINTTFEDQIEPDDVLSWRTFNKVNAYITGNLMTTFISYNHGLLTGDRIELFIGTALDGIHNDVTVPTSDSNLLAGTALEGLDAMVTVPKSKDHIFKTTFTFGTQEGAHLTRKFGLEWRANANDVLRDIYACFNEEESTVCLSYDHGLKTDDVIDVFVAGDFYKRYRVTVRDEDTFEIDKKFDFNGRWRLIYEVKFASQGTDPGWTRVECEVDHELSENERIEVLKSTDYDGSHSVHIIDAVTFEIETPFVAMHYGFWWRINEISDVFPKTGGKTCISPGHDLVLDDLISMFSPEEHIGIYRVNEVHTDGTKFAIKRLTGKWGHYKEIQQFITKADITAILSKDHDLSPGEEIEIFANGQYKGSARVGSVGTDMFNINAVFEDIDSFTGAWTRGKEITGFKDNNKGGTIVESENHGLGTGTQILILKAGYYDGYYMVTGGTKDTFEIDKTFRGKRTYGKELKDPYSMQLTFMFPARTDSERFQNPYFRQVVMDLIRNETPAHIACKLLWLDDESMEDFEAKYKEWMEGYVYDQADLEDKAEELFEKIK